MNWKIRQKMRSVFKPEWPEGYPDFFENESLFSLVLHWFEKLLGKKVSFILDGAPLIHTYIIANLINLRIANVFPTRIAVFPCENTWNSVNFIYSIVQVNVSWVMEFSTCGFKISWILSKIIMPFKEISVFCELK